MRNLRDDPYLQELIEHAQYLQHKPKIRAASAGWDRVMLKRLIDRARARVRVLRAQ